MFELLKLLLTYCFKNYKIAESTDEMLEAMDKAEENRSVFPLKATYLKEENGE